MSEQPYDVVFVGGGLSASLAAYRLRHLRPELEILVLERGQSLGGDHIWSFHRTDLTAAEWHWIAPFIVRTWPAQTVRFPGLNRRLMTPYASITSERLSEIVSETLRGCIRTAAQVTEIAAEHVELAGGERIVARSVIDCRGALRDTALDIGFQKFVGHEIETPKPHGVAEPVIMDATVPQHDGYRFVYLLPFDERRLLIEDTYYSDRGRLDASELDERIAAYRTAHGWDGARELRKERGVLPIALGGDIDKFWRNRRAESACACAGLRAALFHPTTGYTLPDAVALADCLAAHPEFTTASVRQLIEDRSRRLWHRRSYFRAINRLLFLGGEFGERRKIMERFYSLSAGLIERFYSDRLTPLDKARILIGRPPIPITRALQVLPEASLRSWGYPRGQQDDLAS